MLLSEATPLHKRRICSLLSLTMGLLLSFLLLKDLTASVSVWGALNSGEEYITGVDGRLHESSVRKGGRSSQSVSCGLAVDDQESAGQG